MIDLMSGHKFEIDIDETGTTPSMSPLAGGLKSCEPAFNEQVSQDTYFDGDGFSESDVTGGQVILVFSGHRKYDDPAQNFIFSRSLELGDKRRCDFTWTEPDGGKFDGNVTIANITGPSGEANQKGEIGFEIHFNGKPVYTPAV